MEDLWLQGVEIIHFIGHGFKTAAYNARFRETNKVFTLRSLHAMKSSCHEKIQTEVEMMARFAGYNGVVGFVGAWQTSDEVYWLGSERHMMDIETAILRLGGFSLPSAAYLAEKVSTSFALSIFLL